LNIRGRIFLSIVILADPHSNIVALRAVLEAASRTRPSRFLMAGDLVGYGPRPNEVIEIVEKQRMLAIRGNHDQSVISNDYSWMNQFAEAAARWTAGGLTSRSRYFLELLSRDALVEIEGRTIGLYHGSPENPDEYVMDESRAKQLLERSTCDIVICGHTHVPMQIRSGGKLFLNPGSVGQPRDGNPDAAFIELNLRTLKADLRRVRYDVSSVQKEMKSAGLPRFLADRLSEGC